MIAENFPLLSIFYSQHKIFSARLKKCTLPWHLMKRVLHLNMNTTFDKRSATGSISTSTMKQYTWFFFVFTVFMLWSHCDGWPFYINARIKTPFRFQWNVSIIMFKKPQDVGNLQSEKCLFWLSRCNKLMRLFFLRRRRRHCCCCCCCYGCSWNKIYTLMNT